VSESGIEPPVRSQQVVAVAPQQNAQQSHPIMNGKSNDELKTMLGEVLMNGLPEQPAPVPTKVQYPDAMTQFPINSMRPRTKPKNTRPAITTASGSQAKMCKVWHRRSLSRWPKRIG
jgi:hypothetical protein